MFVKESMSKSSLLAIDELVYILRRVNCYQKSLKLDLLRIQMEENI